MINVPHEVLREVRQRILYPVDDPIAGQLAPLSSDDLGARVGAAGTTDSLWR